MKKELRSNLSKSIKRLKVVTKHLVRSQIAGSYSSVFRGRGLEFIDYRNYTPDDDAAMIDWKASVRSKKPLIREFAEERNLNIFFLIDVSSSMIFSSTEKLKIEYAAELITALSYSVLKAGDSISYALFSDKILTYGPPKSGFKQYYKMAKTIVNPKFYGGDIDLIKALKFTLAFLKEFSVVIIVSDFIGLKKDWKHHLKMVGKKFDLIGLSVHDPADRRLPDYDGLVVLGDLNSDRMLMSNISDIKDDYERYMRSEIKDIRQAFVRARADFADLMTDRPFLRPINDLFTRRAKKFK